jgi:2-polyprenyl-3-methyl-5-hydroxy-6-metoxy-1,4-benzoquinol methylase
MWHADLISPGMHVLDVACGTGRHAMAAAARGANVLAMDADEERLRAGEKTAKKAQLHIEWRKADLQEDLPSGPFDMVMVFNYLDRSRMSQFLEMVRPGGYFLAETFLEQQRELGWGPTDDEHLLRPGELWSLVEPLEIVLARDVLEVVDGRPMAVASVLARRPQE